MHVIEFALGKTGHELPQEQGAMLDDRQAGPSAGILDFASSNFPRLTGSYFVLSFARQLWSRNVAGFRTVVHATDHSDH